MNHYYLLRDGVLGEAADGGYQASTPLRERSAYNLRPAATRPAVSGLTPCAAAVPRGWLRGSQQPDVSSGEEVQPVVGEQLRGMYTGPQATHDSDNKPEHSEGDHKTVADESVSPWSE